MTPKLRPRRIGELVRQFKENGMKMMLEDPANVRDVLGLLDVAWRDGIDFSHLDQVKTTFIRRDYRHLASDLIFTAPLIGAGRSRRNLLIYLLIEHQSEPDRLMPLRLADSQVQIFRYQVRKWLQSHPSPARICLRPVLPVLLSYVRAMLYHERSESEQRRLQQIMENSVQNEETRQEVVKMRKTGAEALMERGAQQGAQKAGLLTRRQTLVRLLRKRFGSVPSEVVSVVEATDDVDQLDNWLDRFATAQTLEDLGIGEQE